MSFSSRVAEELAAPCASKGKKEVLFLPLYWEASGANGHSPSPGAEAGLGRGRERAGRLWDRIHKEERSHLKVAERKGI